MPTFTSYQLDGHSAGSVFPALPSPLPGHGRWCFLMPKRDLWCRSWPATARRWPQWVSMPPRTRSRVECRDCWSRHSLLYCSFSWDACWLLFIIVDCCWLLLIVVDCCWLLLIIVDYCWLLLIIVDCCWLLLIILDFMEANNRMTIRKSPCHPLGLRISLSQARRMQLPRCLDLPLFQTVEENVWKNEFKREDHDDCNLSIHHRSGQWHQHLSALRIIRIQPMVNHLEVWTCTGPDWTAACPFMEGGWWWNREIFVN